MTYDPTSILANLGTLAIATLLLFIAFERFQVKINDRSFKLAVGATFGIVAAMVVNFPIQGPYGATLDTRAGPAILAGFFAGPIGAAVTATIGGAARLWVGGPVAIGGAFSFVLYAFAGCSAAWAANRWRNRVPMSVLFLLVAVYGTIWVVPAFFVGLPADTGLAILQRVWPILLGGNIIGVVLLGLVFEEIRRHSADVDATKQAFLTSKLAQEAGQIAIWRYDPVTNRLQWDDLMFDLYGVDPESFTGIFDDWANCVHPDDLETATKELTAAIETGEKFNTNFRIVHPLAGVRWIQAYADFYDIGEGKKAAIGVNFDQTSEIEARAEIEKANQQIEFQNKKLQQFASIASHDLKEPLRKLGVLSSAIYQCVKTSDFEAIDDYKSRIETNLSRANALVDDLLIYARHQQSELTIQSIQVQKLVDTALESVSLLIEETGAEIITTDLDRQVGVDIPAMTAVMKNLIENALKYSHPDRKPRVEIVAFSKKQSVFVAVRDNGQGFDIKQKERIIEPFKRLHLQSDIPGTGLGLAICNEVCKDHNGELLIESTRGTGSTFTIRIPEISPLPGHSRRPQIQLT